MRDLDAEHLSDDQSAPASNKLVGLLRKYHSNFYYVNADEVLYECSLRGLLKKEGTEVLVGDWVELDNVDSATRTARVYQVLNRKNAISRPKMANVDQVLIVCSLRDPHFDPHQMDRYLTHIELAGVAPILCVSKCDLVENCAGGFTLQDIQSLYQDRLGYSLICTSIRNTDSLSRIRELTGHKITVLAGPSGSGKSSLLNALNPMLQLRVGEISEKIARGQHTTRHVELLSLSADDPTTLIADTPGFSNLKFNYVLPTQLEAVYRDFNNFRADCAFSDCLHIDENGCAVLENIDQISQTRYESYLDLIAEARLYKEQVSTTSQKQDFGYKQLDRKGKESVRILRLKEKSRDSSRRRIKQQLDLLDLTDSSETNPDKEGDAADSSGVVSDRLVETPTDSV